MARGKSPRRPFRSVWSNRSPILKCPFCKRLLVHEHKGESRFRAPSRMELRAAGIDSASSEKELSRTHAREGGQNDADDMPEQDEGETHGD